jgi:D-apiose dehydrogenase
MNAAAPARAGGRPLRVGLVGAGWVTQHHLAAWGRLAGRAEVVAIADPDVGRARERARRFAIGAVHADAAAMFAAEALDAVDIAAPRELHAPLVRLAAAHGLAVLCQKPLATPLAEAQALVHDVQAAGVRLMVHENWRFRHWYRRIAGWLAQGRLGALRHAGMTLLCSGLLPDAEGRRPFIERQPFVARLERALVAEVLVHHIDTLRALLGELTLVDARLGRACPAMAGEDHASLLFASAAGVPVHLLADLSVHGEPPGLVDRLLLVGERASVRLEGAQLRLLGPAPECIELDLGAGYQASYDAAIAHFVDALASGAPFETGPEDNLKTLALVERAYTGRQP